ncbi:type II toxin-antitoxin system PemK/MazF family toxin [Cellulosilyticum sp. ST5]|uniref:type II toxin-antitoxin system PemK/MazF family toxin n=1 Tax=Cellulosilyticum sp. ST5 TaxID=3055805 RepID=UPI003977C0CE
MKTDREKAIDCMDIYLKSLESSTNPKDKKKISLISYWMKDYCNYLRKESEFNPKSLKRYERGDIIKVNLGYNIGSEEGGLHYAIVLDKNNAFNSSVITIIPLTSIKNNPNEAHENDIVLGNEIYIKLQGKSKQMMQKAESEHQQIKSNLNIIAKRIDISKEIKEMLSSNNIEDAEKSIQTLVPGFKGDVKKKIDEITEEHVIALNSASSRLEESIRQIEVIKKIDREINRMKKGSIALMEQITTISKLRIYDPKNSYSVLNGIKLSSDSLDKIDEGIRKLYISK